MYQPHYQRQAAAYRRVDVETLVGSANPHQLVALLFEELMRSIQAARGLMEQGDMAGKGAAIGKSVRLLEEGQAKDQWGFEEAVLCHGDD